MNARESGTGAVVGTQTRTPRGNGEPQTAPGRAADVYERDDYAERLAAMLAAARVTVVRG